MSSRRRPSGKKKSSHPNPQPSATRPKWWKRPMTWAVGLVSALILAIVTALGTGIGNSLVTAVKHKVSSPSVSPVKIEQVTPISTGPDSSFVVPGRLQLTRTQLADLNKVSANGDPIYLTSLQKAHHAVPTGTGSISITVLGNSSTTVTITGIRVIKQCRLPLNGTYFYSPGAGEDTTIDLGFDLDSDITYAQDTRGGQTYSGNWFLEHVVTLKPGEPQTFRVYVTTSHHYCRFTFQMTVATPQGVVTERIPTNGNPFELTADLNFSSYQAVYAGDMADAENNYAWMQVNPKTYNGGNPASFPPTPTGN